MTWYANQIYARPKPDVIAAFQTQPVLADHLYHVTDLHGVRANWTREMLLSEQAPEDRAHMRHSLPPGGLLVVWPSIYRTGHDRHEPQACDDIRAPDWPPAAKWRNVDSPVDIEPFFPPHFDRECYPLGVLRVLKWVYTQTSSPMLYYQCLMWGGEIEEETAWVIDAEDRVYQFQDYETVIEHTSRGTREIQGDLLQRAMGHVGVDLPTRFFALHECSFDWKLYWLRSVAG